MRAWGFSFRPLAGYDVVRRTTDIIITSSFGDRFFEFFVLSAPTPLMPNHLLEVFTELVNSEEGFELEVGTAEATMVGPIQGVTAEVTGKITGQRVGGQVSITKPSPTKAFFAYTLVGVGTDRTEWRVFGRDQINAMLSSLQFSDITVVGDSCPVSARATFGTSRSTPIPIGGGRVGALLLEDLYLHSMRGPGGEPLRFEISDSMFAPSANLDSYLVSYDGLTDPITLYFDPYSFAAPIIPPGFSCGPEFPYEIPATTEPGAET